MRDLSQNPKKGFFLGFLTFDIVVLKTWIQHIRSFFERMLKFKFHFSLFLHVSRYLKEKKNLEFNEALKSYQPISTANSAHGNF